MVSCFSTEQHVENIIVDIVDSIRPMAADRRPPPYVPADPLLNAAQAALETGRGVSTFYRDVKAGLLPPAIYVTPGSPRWRLSELRAAIDACPRGRGRVA